jgi:tetratricopeptide (TPR) repeat protein
MPFGAWYNGRQAQVTGRRANSADVHMRAGGVPADEMFLYHPRTCRSGEQEWYQTMTSKTQGILATDVTGANPTGSTHQNSAQAVQLAAERALAQATQRGDIPAALRIASTLIRLDPDSALHHFNKALLYQHQSEIGMAVNEFMLAIWLDPDGPQSDPARCFLEDLDTLQLRQIAVLAEEDLVFRTKLERNCYAAAGERGYTLSPVGEQLLREYCESTLTVTPIPARASRYH